ncbi:DUF1800 domain-containing protein [Colwellia echini]|uniref:DUF1800 domain-containing protein n=1 Tax=Colwellia echini TaxID=1982103 RepID=A0ABY3MWF0_9GAMM|nr:DUF1800 domain-containing protein [Colwellia echini]
MNKAQIAVNRFGYGAREGELLQAESNPKQWIIGQLQPITFNDDFPSSEQIFLQHEQYKIERNRLKNLEQMNQSGESTSMSMQERSMAENAISSKNLAVDNNMQNLKSMARKNMRAMSANTIKQAISSSNSVSWRLLDLFSNHFSVTANGRLMSGLSATLEREAIAPNMLGKFADLLLAVEQHPAMLIYLNNEKSIGPNSRFGKKSISKKNQLNKTNTQNKPKGINENLAREILELHTLGVNGGYSQVDVIELAKGISGWTVLNPSKTKDTGFTFNAKWHEPGVRYLLGKHYPDDGVAQGEKMLRDIAANPATAKYVCYKLAHHFVSEKPSKALLTSMEMTWQQTDGDIKQVMIAMFNNDDAWLDTPQKFKTPREFIISTGRAFDASKVKDNLILGSMKALGQMPFQAGSPAGYSDNESDWLGASALMARIDWSVKLSAFQKNINVEKTMQTALALAPTSHTYQSIIRAESREQALTLLLMSPEFQRR